MLISFCNKLHRSLTGNSSKKLAPKNLVALDEATSFVIEGLESRRMLSETWSVQTRQIGLDQETQNFPTINGNGEAIAIIDTGVGYTNPSLGGAFGGGNKVEAGYDFIDNDGDPFTTSNGHGTGSAGEAAGLPYYVDGQRYQGVAPGAKVIAFRENSSAGVKASLDWIVANRTKYNIVAVNMIDWGGDNPTSYTSELDSLYNSNVYLSAPAGNGGSNTWDWWNHVLYQVGSVDSNDNLSGFSNRGSAVDVLAPGQGVMVNYYNPGNGQWFNGYSDGTSWSSPQIVGAAALIHQVNPNFTDPQILSILQNSGKRINDSSGSYSRLDVNAAVAMAYQLSGITPAAVPAPVPASTPAPAPAPTPAPSPGSNASNGSTPFSGSPVAVPTVIQAENFDNGGQGVGYYDRDAAGWGYRSSGVQIYGDSNAKNSNYVGCTEAGEWMQYSINVGSDGSYDLSATVASLWGGGKFHVNIDGSDVTGEMNIGDTGSWNRFQNDSKTGIYLTSGVHTMRVVMDAAGLSGNVGNFDQFTLKASEGSTASNVPSVAPAAAAYTPATTGETPYYGTPINAFNHIDASDFDNGGQGIGYFDRGSSGFGYRNSGTQIYRSDAANAGQYVGTTEAGEWLKYTVDAPTSGTYGLNARVASLWSGGSFHVEVDGNNVTGTIGVPDTGGWTHFQTIRKNGITLSAGTHVIRVVMDSNGASGNVGNFDWFSFS